MNVPATCPLCGALAPSPDGRRHSEGGTQYTLYRCESCLVEFWWPLKNPGSAWYSAHERYAGRNADPIWEASWNYKKIISYLAPFCGKVFDVGCGIGTFLGWAAEHGWDCSGIDFDADAIAAAGKRFGLQNLEVSDVATYAAAHPEAKFDLVTFFDVLEHIDNHNEFMDAVRCLLAPGGYIAMSMPYRKHAEWLMPFDLPPAHLTRWDRTSLRRFLEVRGFRVVYMTRRTEGIWNIVIRLRFRYGKRLSFGAVRIVREKCNDTGANADKRRPALVRVVHVLAKLKDGLLFGIPALVIWIGMLCTPKRYATLYAIARKTV